MAYSVVKQGEIRHVTKNPDVIIKVIGPFQGETFHKSEKITKLDFYILTKEFPKYHYVVILNTIDSFTAPGNKFYVAKLITHSSNFNNLKITEDLYDTSLTTINLSTSYITRDLFLIPEEEVLKDKVYGFFNLAKLKENSEY